MSISLKLTPIRLVKWKIHKIQFENYIQLMWFTLLLLCRAQYWLALLQAFKNTIILHIICKLLSISYTLYQQRINTISSHLRVCIFFLPQAVAPCTSSPCLNGGLCQNTISGTFLCNCVNTGGYTGSRCEFPPGGKLLYFIMVLLLPCW